MPWHAGKALIRVFRVLRVFRVIRVLKVLGNKSSFLQKTFAVPKIQIVEQRTK